MNTVHLQIKAWHIFDGDPYESSLLIFASSANRARQMAHGHGTWEYEEYIFIRARRAPKWDGCFSEEKIIDTNDDLPTEAPRFYDDGGCG